MTDIATHQTFEDRMMGRIRESIGELMSDEDLRKIVERGVEKALFDRRELPKQDYGGYRRVEEAPSIVETAAREYLDDKVTECVREWITDNPDRFEQIIGETIEKGIVKALSDAIGRLFASSFHTMSASIENQIREIRGH